MHLFKNESAILLKAGMNKQALIENLFNIICLSGINPCTYRHLHGWFHR